MELYLRQLIINATLLSRLRPLPQLQYADYRNSMSVPLSEASSVSDHAYRVLKY